MSFYPNQPGPQLLVDMVNATLGKTFVTDDFTFGTPRPVERSDGRNTAIDLTVARGVLMGQVATVYYKRLDLGLLLDPREIELEVDTSATHTTDLVPHLNSQFGWALGADDVINVPLEVLGDDPVAQTLMAHPDSMICIGSGTCLLAQTAFGAVFYNSSISRWQVNPETNLTWADTSNANYARFDAVGMEIGLRFMSEDINSNFIDTPSDVNNEYLLPVLDSHSWYMALALYGPEAQSLAEAGRLQLVVTVGAEQVVYPIGWNGSKYTINLGGWTSQSFGPPEDPTVGMFRLSMTHSAFGTNFATVPANSNSTLLEAFEFEVQILNATLDATLGSLPVNVNAVPAP